MGECAGGKGVLVQELNSKDAFVAAPGGAAITVESLAGTCVLSAGGPSPNCAAGAWLRYFDSILPLCKHITRFSIVSGRTAARFSRPIAGSPG